MKFIVENLGIQSPSFFQGYGLGPNSPYTLAIYGIGDTPSEALDNCLERLSGTIKNYSQEMEDRIVSEFGEDNTTVQEEEGLTDEEMEEIFENGEGLYWHVGIKGNFLVRE